MKFIKKQAVLFLILVAFSPLSISSASAQQRLENRQFEMAEDMELNLPPANEIPARHLQEMNDVYEDCMQDSFESSHRDCRCYSMAYLEARLQTPSISRAMVETAVDNVCYSTDVMAGHYNNKCLNTVDIGSIDTRRKDPVALCECFGRSVARAFPNMNRVDFRVLKRVQKNAYSECGFFN